MTTVKIKKQFAILMLFSFLSLNTSFVYAQTTSEIKSRKQSTIKIITYSSTNQIINQGAGIVVGKEDDFVFIVTAYHVIEGSQKIKIKFFKRKWKAFDGDLFDRYNGDLDIGVIVVKPEVKDAYDGLTAIPMKKSLQFRELAPVISIGHPSVTDWQLSKNEILSPTYEENIQKLTFTNIAIDRGCSGGPLFDSRLNIMGMIINKGSGHAIAVKFDAVLKLLNNWDIPTNLVSIQSLKEVTTTSYSLLKKPTTIQVKEQLRNTPLTLSKNDLNLDENWRMPQYKNIKNNYSKINDTIVVDQTTGLMWQKSGSEKKLSYTEAHSYVKNLNKIRFAGFNDWHLPTIPELMSLLEAGKYSNGLFIDPIFDNKIIDCWSFDTKKDSPGLAWYIDFSKGKVYHSGYLLGSRFYIRAVRSLK